ncbi:MAG: hypothetical protein J6D54_03150 [Olsenella sp.]|nr:hypothetical protein [Olsenella sp.]
MDLSQVKTVKGFVPIKGAKADHVEEDGTVHTVNTTVTFDVLTPTELAAMRKGNVGEQSSSLVDLASCVKLLEKGDDEKQKVGSDLFDYACRVGPLFGFDTHEHLLDWANAANAAHLALRAQECVNGSKKVNSLNKLGQIIKTRAIGADGEYELVLLHFLLQLSGAYDEMVNQDLLARRIEIGEKYLYSFAVRTRLVERNDESYIAIFVVRLDHELTFAEYDFLKGEFASLLNLNEDSLAALESEEVRSEIRLDGDGAFYGASLQGEMTSEQADLSDEDADSLSALVQTLVSLHLTGVSVDVFRGTEDTGYLSFESLLSYLWFDFARTASKVSIGYCQYCGRAFSIAGHRGLKRLYCSASCKTADKNRRTKKDVDKVREYFRDGMSVKGIADKVYRGKKGREAKVRKVLSSSVDLKRRLDASIEEEGWRRSELLKRCDAEGLDLKTLLNSRRQQELKELLSSERASRNGGPKEG